LISNSQIEGDDPDISDYIGDGDLALIYSKNRNVYSFEGSHNFNLKGAMRGSAAFS
jgi:phospholipase A1